MSEEVGIKELKEALDGVVTLGLVSIKTFKDGFQVEDLGVLMATVATDQSVKAGLEDISKVGAEIKDLSLAEGIELGMHLAKRVPDFIAAFKG